MKIRTRKALKFILLILLICLTTSMFTGCGFVGADTTNHDNDIKYGEGGGGSTNNLCTVWKDQITTADTNGASGIKANGLWGVPLKATTNYGSAVNGDGGLTLLRDFAVTMYESLFDQTYTYTGSDNFTGSNEFGKFNLQPGDLIVKVNSITSSAISANGALGGVTSAVKGMAAAILIAVWAMGFISQIVNEKFTIEILLKTLMQLMCGIVLITNSTVIVEAFAQAGNELVGSMTANASSSLFDGFKSALDFILVNGIFSISIGLSIGTILQFGLGTIWLDYGSIVVLIFMIIPFIGQVICAYKIVSAMIMRMLELTVRITFAPIPIAFSAQQGFSQEAIRYFRGILACAMQPVLMLVGVACFETIASAIMEIFGGTATSVLSGAIAMTLAYLVLAAYLGQTKQMSQEIIAR
jgi:hypothetical protein